MLTRKSTNRTAGVRSNNWKYNETNRSLWSVLGCATVCINGLSLFVWNVRKLGDFFLRCLRRWRNNALLVFDWFLVGIFWREKLSKSSIRRNFSKNFEKSICFGCYLKKRSRVWSKHANLISYFLINCVRKFAFLRISG